MAYFIDLTDGQCGLGQEFTSRVRQTLGSLHSQSSLRDPGKSPRGIPGVVFQVLLPLEGGPPARNPLEIRLRGRARGHFRVTFSRIFGLFPITVARFFGLFWTFSRGGPQ